MTPKEKAKKLVNESFLEMEYLKLKCKDFRQELSKECALISVNQMMQDDLNYGNSKEDDWLTEVKQQINKL